MRVIDEIEDHPQLRLESKNILLNSISRLLKKPFNNQELMALLYAYNSILPEVTLRFSDWIKLCPPTIVENMSNATSTMAKGMADWTFRLKNHRLLIYENVNLNSFDLPFGRIEKEKRE